MAASHAWIVHVQINFVFCTPETLKHRQCPPNRLIFSDTGISISPETRHPTRSLETFRKLVLSRRLRMSAYKQSNLAYRLVPSSLGVKVVRHVFGELLHRLLPIPGRRGSFLRRGVLSPHLGLTRIGKGVLGHASLLQLGCLSLKALVVLLCTERGRGVGVLVILIKWSADSSHPFGRRMVHTPVMFR